MTTQHLDESTGLGIERVGTHTCVVQCDDAAVRLRIETWLRSLDIRWPGPFTLTVSVADADPFPSDSREVFQQPSLRIQAGKPSHEVRIEWELAPATALVHPNLATASVWFSATARKHLELAERSFLMVLLIFVLRRLGWFHVHGAALVDSRNRGWLLVGDSNSGKSTTCALLATRGWQVATDDTGFLAPVGDRIGVVGALSQIALRDGGRALLGAQGGLSIPQRDKTGFWAEELGATRASMVVPEIIAFTRIGARTAMVPSVPRRALAQLLNSSPWMLYEPAFAQEHLNVLSQVAAQSRCYELSLGPDLFTHPGLLEELIA